MGYKRVPNGYQVDHIRPLSEGGRDTPDNMQLITKESHKYKTAQEKHNHKKTSTKKTYKKKKR
ncbi:MAG TPA: HNH endonuclease signature motif containing protein [Ignavibacteria bacterium]